MSTRRDTPLERNGADFTASQWVRHPNYQVLQRAKTHKDDAHCSPQANPNFVVSAAPDLPQDLPEHLKKRHRPVQEEMYIGNIRVPPSMRPERAREVEEWPKKRCFFGRKALHSTLAILAAAGAAYIITQGSTHYAVDAAAETQHAALAPAAAVPVARPLGESLKAAQMTSEQKDPEPSPVASPSQPNLLDPQSSPHRPALPTGASPPSSDVAPTKTAVRLPEMPKVEDAATTAAASAPIPSATELDKETIALFIKRGEQFIDAGDFASARVVLRRAAEAGDQKAALAMAGTYDPAALKRLGVKGMAPDPERARYWYQKARSLGSPEAPNLLKQLANRTK